MKRTELKNIIKEEIISMLEETSKNEIMAMRPVISPEVEKQYSGMSVDELLVVAKRMTEEYVNGKI